MLLSNVFIYHMCCVRHYILMYMRSETRSAMLYDALNRFFSKYLYSHRTKRL